MLTTQREASIASLPLGVLHLGRKALWLSEAGYTTVGDVSDVDSAILLRIPLVGRNTTDELVRKRNALIDASKESDGTDWDAYCEAIGIPLLPTRQRPETGEAFVEAIQAFFLEVADNLSDPTAVAILCDRICLPPGKQSTLEDIASLSKPPITRERVRQKEEKLLCQLAGGLLNDDYDTLPLHFHPSFARWWRLAADALADLDEVDVMTFIDILCGVWKISRPAIMRQLPIIVAIVTGEPQMSGQFRAAARLNGRLLGYLTDAALFTPLIRLRLGKHAALLNEAGYLNLGDLIDKLQSGGFEQLGITTARHTAAHLDILGNCISSEGNVDWNCYRQALEFSSVPTSSPSSPAEFAAGLRDALDLLLGIHAVTKRAAKIFRMRTSRDPARRMTLHRVADELRTHAPTIKREETVLLQWLNDAVVGHNFSMLKVWLDEPWLGYWADAEGEFERANGDYDRFAGNLAWRWRLDGKEIIEAAPAIWAVLTGYAGGRPTSPRAPATAMQAEGVLGRIRLKGFRRFH